MRPPKFGSERVVYLDEGSVTVRAGHVSADAIAGEDRWLFAGEGDPPHQNTIGYWWRKTLRDAGITSITLDDLRQFYASGLIAAGCAIVTVQCSLGSAKATITLKAYAHPLADRRGPYTYGRGVDHLRVARPSCRHIGGEVGHHR